MKRPVQITNPSALAGKTIRHCLITYDDVVITLEDRSFILVEPGGYTEGYIDLDVMERLHIITAAEHLEIKKVEHKLEQKKKREEAIETIKSLTKKHNISLEEL